MNRHYKTLRAIKSPNSLRILARIVLSFLLIFILFLIVTPWRQTSKGVGQIIASDPNLRMQNINAPLSGRINKWYVKDGDYVKKDDKIAEISDNDPQILDRINDEKNAKIRKLQNAQAAADTAKIDFERQEELFNKGLSSRKNYEYAKIEYKKLLSAKESAQAELAETQTKASRQERQVVTAPQDGRILKIITADSSLVKASERIATFAPNLDNIAIELYVSGNDIPLIYEGAKVRLQFEGWPAVQFSGWPSIAIGTFGGEVSSIDPSISENGKFRIIVKKDENENWPDARFLRHGGRVYGWVLLNNVKLGYEIWRQVNGFPPSFDSEIKAIKNEAK